MTRTILHKLLFLLIPSIVALIISKEVYAYDNPPIGGKASTSATDVCRGSSFTIKYENVLLFVENPPSIMGNYRVTPAGFGPSVTGLIQGILVLANDGSGNASDACDPIINSAELSGNIALIDRGTCSFTSKVLKAQQAGAVAVIVVNNVSTSPITMGGDDPAITIPSLMISKADGDLIKANMITSPVHIKLGDLSTDAKTWQYWEDAFSNWIDFADASPNPLSIEATNPHTMVNGLPGNRYRVKVSNSIGEDFSNEIAVSFNQLPVAGTAVISATAACFGSTYSIDVVGESNVNGYAYWQNYFESNQTWRSNNGTGLLNATFLAIDPFATVNGLPGDRFRAVQQNSCGEQFSNEISIMYAPYPEVSITAVPENNTYTGNNPNTIYLGYGPQKVNLQSSVTGDIGNGFNYNWTGTGLSCNNCASPEFKPTAPGNYNFTLTASTIISASETGNNNALQLNGIDNYIEDNSLVIDQTLDGFTVEGWIKINNADGKHGFAAKTRENIPAPFDIYINNGAVNFLVGDGDNYFIATTPGIITSNTWYHIACVYSPQFIDYDQGTIKDFIIVYVNGAEQARSEVNSNLIADKGTSFRIGSRSDNYYFTNGQIDEIRIWQVWKSASAVTEKMNSTIWPYTPGLIAYYKLDETSGTSLLESVSNTNRGILRGSSANWVIPTTSPVQLPGAGLCPTSKSITICVKDVRVPGKNKQVYICHNSGKKSISISLNPEAVPAHLAHGDALGKCGQGCGSPAAIALKGIGLAIDKAAEGMMVYPNPANNTVTVSFNAEKTEKYQLLVTDITGRAVLTRSDNAVVGKNKVLVNIGGIASGTYIIIVKKGDGILHTRMVKQ